MTKVLSILLIFEPKHPEDSGYSGTAHLQHFPTNK